MTRSAKKRNAVITAILIAAIVVLLLLNFLFAHLTNTHIGYADITPEGLYTLTDKMEETCGKLKGDITLTFCSDPDILLEGYETRYAYAMALALANRFDNIRVETYNIAKNPTAVNRFRTTSATVIKADDLIVSCEGRYRIISTPTFWTFSEDGDEKEYYSFNGEYKLATALLSVTSVVKPVVCFPYSHGEHIYVPESREDVTEAVRALSDPTRSAFYGMMEAEGLTVRYIDLDTEEIPEDCTLIVFDGPAVDYGAGNPVSMTEKTPFRKLQTFLTEKNGSFMLFKDPDVILPNMEDFAADWGVAYQDGSYVREDAYHALSDPDGLRQKVIPALVTDDTLLPYSIYSDISTLPTSPRCVVENTGYVKGSWTHGYGGAAGTQNVMAKYFDFFSTSDKAMTFSCEDGSQTSEKPASYALAGISMRMLHDTYTDEGYYSYFFGAATTELTKNTYLEDPAFCNYDLLFATVRFISRVDEYASIELGGTSLNSPSLGGKPLLTTTISEEGNVRYRDGREAGKYDILTDARKIVRVTLLVTVPLLVSLVAAVIVIRRRKNR